MVANFSAAHAATYNISAARAVYNISAARAAVYNFSAAYPYMHYVNRSDSHPFADFPAEGGAGSESGEYVLMITVTKPMMVMAAVVVLLLTVLMAFNIYHCCVANGGVTKYQVVKMA